MEKKTKAVIAASAAGAVLIGEELYRYTFRRNSSSLCEMIFDSKGHEENYYKTRDEAAEKFRETDHEEYYITSARGERLKGFYYPCGSEGKEIVFIVHGYRSEHAETAGQFYDYYKSRGIDIFCCDNTASGESGGDYVGFDVFETEDCLLWIRFLLKKFGSDVKIILHGLSMGGATVLRMSSRCPDNVKFIISDSGYMNAQTTMKRRGGIYYQPLRLVNRFLAGYDVEDSDVTESLKKASVPILFVHGQEDRFVPFKSGARLYAMYGGEKDYFFPENTRHIESIYTSPEEYGKKIDRFIEKYI